MNKVLLVMVAFCTAAAGTVAFAAPNKFSRADGNRDGALNRIEACVGKTPNVCRNFVRMDVNRDGVVTRSEIRAYNNVRRTSRGLPPKRY